MLWRTRYDSRRLGMALVCATALVACDGALTVPSGPTHPPGPAFDILDMPALLADQTVKAAATGHAVEVLVFYCPRPECPAPPAGGGPKHTYSFSAVRHTDGSYGGEIELKIEDAGTTETVHGTVVCLNAVPIHRAGVLVCPRWPRRPSTRDAAAHVARTLARSA